MNATDIVAYTFDAAYHCTSCTEKRTRQGTPHYRGFWQGERGEVYGTDSERNEIHPVFVSDLTTRSVEACTDCNGTICLQCGDVHESREIGASCSNCGQLWYPYELPDFAISGDYGYVRVRRLPEPEPEPTWTGHVRYVYQWWIIDASGELLETRDDLRTGVDHDHGPRNMIHTLATFLEAFSDARAYGTETTENWALFLDTAAEWAIQHSEDIYFETHVFEYE